MSETNMSFETAIYRGQEQMQRDRNETLEKRIEELERQNAQKAEALQKIRDTTEDLDAEMIATEALLLDTSSDYLASQVKPLVEELERLRKLVPIPPNAITWEHGWNILDYLQGEFLPKATDYARDKWPGLFTEGGAK